MGIFNFSGGKPMFEAAFGAGSKTPNQWSMNGMSSLPSNAFSAKNTPSPWSLQSIMQSPYTKFGLKMMEQGGPQPGPRNVGQDISRAVGGMQQDEDAQAAKQFRDMQMEMMRKQQEAAMRQLSFLDESGSYNGGMSASTPPAYR